MRNPSLRERFTGYLVKRLIEHLGHDPVEVLGVEIHPLFVRVMTRATDDAGRAFVASDGEVGTNATEHPYHWPPR